MLRNADPRSFHAIYVVYSDSPSSPSMMPFSILPVSNDYSIRILSFASSYVGSLKLMSAPVHPVLHANGFCDIHTLT